MKARAARRRMVSEADVPLSSMIDVVFLLLIYFIVTQKPIMDNVFLQTDLPAPSKTPPENLVAPLAVDVRGADGDDYALMGRRMDRKALFAYLREVAGNEPEHPLVINCGPNAEHQKLIHLLDACAEMGLGNLNVVNDESIPFNGAGRR